jgi:hypothetical protein
MTGGLAFFQFHPSVTLRSPSVHDPGRTVHLPYDPFSKELPCPLIRSSIIARPLSIMNTPRDIIARPLHTMSPAITTLPPIMRTSLRGISITPRITPPKPPSTTPKRTVSRAKPPQAELLARVPRTYSAIAGRSAPRVPHTVGARPDVPRACPRNSSCLCSCASTVCRENRAHPHHVIPNGACLRQTGVLGAGKLAQ